MKISEIIQSPADIARTVREFLQPHWSEWHANKKEETAKWSDTPYENSHPSSSMCRFAAVFLAAVLKRETGTTWQIYGGSPYPPQFPDGGMRGMDGNWYGHYWVQKDGRILDITADQFGYDPVVITQTGDDRYKANYSPQELKQHLNDAKITPAKWLKAFYDGKLVEGARAHPVKAWINPEKKKFVLEFDRVSGASKIEKTKSTAKKNAGPYCRFAINSPIRNLK